MKLPKFLLADNSDFPEDLFVVHTEYPRFILNVEEEEVEWLDDLEGDDEETMADEATKVVEAAFKWCEDEIPVSQILALTPEKPLIGHRSGKQQKTHWIAFLKEA